jgi:methionine sulfoxide reductase heme-binding subunit
MTLIYRRILIFLAALSPLVYLIWAAFANRLGTDPAKVIVITTGQFAFYLLLCTLAVTPLRRMFNRLSWLQRHRRMLGLFTLFYVILHVTAFAGFILGWDLSVLGQELIKRFYIFATLPALILLILMGITSTQAMMRRLGKNWIKLHKTIYWVAILAWLHVLLQVRADYQEVVIFGLGLLLLLGIRLYWKFRR